MSLFCPCYKQNNRTRRTILLKPLHEFNAIPIRISVAFLTELEKTNLKFHMEPKETYNSRAIVGNKGKAGTS